MGDDDVSGRGGDALLETRSLPPRPSTKPPVDRPYLLVLELGSSSRVNLPLTGEVVLGRADDVEVRLGDTAVSRRHARIVVTDGEAAISDLGSQNGTFVDDERVVGSRPLLSGDVITLCDVTVVFHGSRRPVPRPTVLPIDRLRTRVDEELERATRHGDPVTLVALGLGPGPVDRPAVIAALAEGLRSIEVLAWSSRDQLLVLLPDTGPEEAAVACNRLLDRLSSIAPQARGGFASHPADAGDADALLEAARAAATAAEPAGQAAATQAFRRLEIGGRSVIVADPAMSRLYQLVERLAPSALPILVCGETGSGKELVASAIHAWSPRRSARLVALNCAAIQETLLESELFGHEKGAFSGAVATKQGLVEAAHGGTLFLDEVGELSLAVQAKLLRVLEEKKFSRVGDVKEREVDIRIVAATNRDLVAESKAGRFREDLYFRLGGATVWLPPLRDRPRDLPLLANELLGRACAEAKRAPMAISDGAMRLLAAHRWPGNVRELRNAMDFFASALVGGVLSEGDVAEHLGVRRAGPPLAEPAPAAVAAPEAPAFQPIAEELRALERQRMTEALAACGGNRTQAAALIHMPLRTFMMKLKQYDLVPR